MLAYLVRRLLLMIPTLLGILLVTFVIVQFAPGGPVERMIAQIRGADVTATAQVGGVSGDLGGGSQSQDLEETSGSVSAYRGAQGMDPELIAQLERQFGFDRPAHERFLKMLWDYARFDLGQSYYRDISVVDLVIEKMPVSISLGFWTTLFVYSISIPLGIRKAVRDGSRFDVWTSGVIVVGYAVPNFLFAVLLIVLFSGGTYWELFPLRGILSPGWTQLSWPELVADYAWHMTLPVAALLISGFATTTLLTKNSFLDEIRKHYVVTARSKGLTQRGVLYGHVFRNAMLIVISGFPAAFVAIFFTGALLIEVIFSLDGLGLLGFESIINRDYPVVFGTLYVFGLIGLILNLITDLTYTWIDPRIDFDTMEV